MDLAVFYEVIVPLMEVEGTATICISTPLDEFNFYSELTELRDDKGRLIFNVKHIKGNIPVPWKSAEGEQTLSFDQQSVLSCRLLLSEFVPGFPQLARACRPSTARGAVRCFSARSWARSLATATTWRFAPTSSSAGSKRRRSAARTTPTTAPSTSQSTPTAAPRAATVLALILPSSPSSSLAAASS